MELVKMNVADLIPYENNPRHNEQAVDAVAESIRQCGYVAPIIVDEDNIILAGHTRRLALMRLGYDKADVIVKAGLSDEQKRKYRLLDNKTAEFADWDFDKLEEELAGLDFGDFDFGWEDEDSADSENSEENNDDTYTMAVNVPQYEITGECPEISEMADTTKSDELIEEILKADIPEDVRAFLVNAAYRHIVFNYKNIAEYYAHADKDVQELFEKSALVIIDVDDAIKYGYCRMNSEIMDMIGEDDAL